MSFFFGRSTKSDRAKHISELMSKVPGITHVDSSNLKFQCILASPANGQVSSIMITLLEQFPSNPPIVSVQGPLRHPWIDTYNFVAGCVSLNRWTSTSSLADVISEIKLVLEAGYNASSGCNGGTKATNAIGMITAINPDAANDAGVQAQYPGQAHRNQQPQGQQQGRDAGKAEQESERYDPFPAPEIPTSFANIKQLSEEQLQRLLDDDIAFGLLVRESFTDARLEQLSSLQSSNVAQAQESLKRDEGLGQKKQEVNALQAQLAGLVDTYKVKLQELATSGVDDSAAVSREHVLAQLKDKEADLEEKSDTLGQSFMDGATNVQTFVPQYHELRKKIYSLRAKIRATL